MYTPHSKANVSLVSGEIDLCDQTYESCRITLRI